MHVSELYRQRAAECERMAVAHPEERKQLNDAARTWRWLAEAAEELAHNVTIH